ncbi:MAG TPA: Xaa-Pro peptidase family protein [Candidatus Stackebrandtia excrementipullorum]|nr:Xaa-Pro peptidase family protein [Candidatus Stackebrandtia excrementipullorum]
MTASDHSSALFERRAGFLEALSARNLAGAVVCSPEAVTWLSGATIPTQRIMRDRLSMVVASVATGSVELLTSTVEVNMATRQTSIPVGSYVEFAEEPIVAGVRRLRAMDPKATRIGIETGYLSVDAFTRLQAQLSDPIYEPLGDWFPQLRQVKDTYEIDLLGELGRHSESIVADVFAGAYVGVTERRLYNDMLRGVHERGFALNHATLSSGANVNRSHHRADETPLSPGDLVRVDMGVSSGGYVSDIARMAVVGEPSARQASRYRHAVEAERWMIDRMRPGVDVPDLFRQWRQRLDQVGASTSMALVAHGIGLALHEDPQLQRRSVQDLRPGMVLCVEPMIEYPDGEVYHIEDLVLVTESAPRYLTDPAGVEAITVISGGSA